MADGRRGRGRLRALWRRPRHADHPHGSDGAGTTALIDQRGIPTHACLNCGCNVFTIQAVFEEYDISGWYLDGACSCCGSPLTVPCPVDDPEA